MTEEKDEEKEKVKGEREEVVGSKERGEEQNLDEEKDKEVGKSAKGSFTASFSWGLLFTVG